MDKLDIQDKITLNSISTKFTKREKILNNKKILNCLYNIFLNKDITKKIHDFLNYESSLVFKNFLNKNFSLKERKKQIKERIKDVIIDTGNHNELYKYRIIDRDNLILTTSIFNVDKNLIKSFTKIKYNSDVLELQKPDYYQFLKLYNKFYFYLCNDKETIKVCKSLVPYDEIKSNTINEDDEYSNKKDSNYEMFYDDKIIDEKMKQLSIEWTDYSKEGLINKQKKILEILNSKVEEEFYPLKFIINISYWAIILCQGGYFACGFFNKDKLIEHKSDHKYVVRKKAGQRQVVKDNAKKTIKNSVGAQLRREGEKKHQENIECILKLNEELLSKCEAIFLFAPGINKNILIGGNEKTLFSYKNKVLNIPFSVNRANYSHMMEIYERLTSVNIELSM